MGAACGRVLGARSYEEEEVTGALRCGALGMQSAFEDCIITHTHIYIN